MVKTLNKNQKGLTFAEVVICIFIVALVVGPITASFSSSTKDRVSAERINEATVNAEKLTEEIKNELTTDIIEKQRRDGNQVEINALSTEDKNHYDNIVNKYLNPTNSIIDRAFTETLSDYLRHTEAELNQAYNTDQYAYEVLLWNINDAPIDATTKTLTVNTAALSTATKLYTSPSYKFNVGDYTNPNLPVTFNISDEILKAFKDAEERYIVNLLPADKNYEVVDINKIDISESMAVTKTSKHSKIELSDPSTSEITVKGVCKGYRFDISKPTGVTINATPTPLSIIEVDLTKLLRNKDTLAITTTYDEYTFKFVNHTDVDQIIRIKRTETTAEDLSAVDKRYNVIAETIPTSTAKTTIERINEIEPYDNFIMAVIVRETDPVTGKKGKVVKKMLDIYSYDVTTHERR